MKKKLLFVLLGVFLISGCGPEEVTSTPIPVDPKATSQPPTATFPSPTQTPTPVIEIDLEKIMSDFPLVDGSTSAQPLQAYIACQIFEVKCSWSEAWLFDGTRAIFPDEEVWDETPSEIMDLILQISHSGTHGSYVNLIHQYTDFILVAREPSSDEIEEAESMGVFFDIQPVALDAFVFLANIENPVESLGVETIREIYTGEITIWGDAEVGGTDETIHTYQRNRNSGSQGLMEKLVMKGAQMTDSPDMILPSMIGPINAIGDDPLGIGYSVYFYAVNIYPDEKVKLLGINGVHPTSETIAESSYPLTTEVYAVIRQGTPVDSTAAMLRAWLFTSEGKSAIAGSGYVPIP